MPDATFAFLNCKHLDYTDGNKVPTKKISNLRETLLDAGGGQPPCFFGLCEVHSVALARRLADKLDNNAYDIIVSTADAATMGAMGLALCYNRDLFALVDVVRDRSRRSRSNIRSYWLAVQLRLQVGSKASLWVILNHWKSSVGGELETELRRVNTFWEVDELFRETSDLRLSSDKSGAAKPLIGLEQFVLMAGDFNCEPGSRPLGQPNNTSIEFRRHIGAVTDSHSARMLFLNTM
jgi:hypothetical protein